MTRGQFETAKEIIDTIKYLETIKDILEHGDDIRIVLKYFEKTSLKETDLTYLDSDTVDALFKAVSTVIDNRLKVYNTRLEEL